jgi:Tol biopolymer transport system component
VAVLALLAAGAVLRLWPRDAALPPGLSGTLVFVSDRDGVDALYARRLPRGQDRRLTYLDEPVESPAVSRDGRFVAFGMGGRIGIVPLAGGEARFLTLGVDWRDASPGWRADGEALVVAARRPGAAHADIHLLTALDAPPGQVERQPVTFTSTLDEASPVFGPDGSFIVFVRQDNLYRFDFAGGRTRRITGGFQRMREPRFLPSGRLLSLWSQEKRFGIDVMDPDGAHREKLWEGTAYYRTISPSPTLPFFAATFTYDLGFHPTAALRLRQTEELRLLDGHGGPAGTLAASRGHSSHSAVWAR